MTRHLRAPSPDRCYWYRDGEDEVLIPMCMGCAVAGIEECTCDVPGSEIDRVHEEVREARDTIDWLHERLTYQRTANETLHRNNNSLRQRVRDLLLGRR